MTAGPAPSGAPAAAQRLPRLTSLRFFAAAAVVVNHCSNQIPALNSLRPHVGYGYTAVTFFFVLSGFVLTWGHDPSGSIQAFYRRRFARIWPLHVVTTLVAAVLMWSLGESQDLPGLALAIPLLHAWAPSLETTFAYNGPSWSLACEAFFYAGFPALLPAARRLLPRPARLVAAGAVLAALMTTGTVAFLVLTPPAIWYSVGFSLYVNPVFRLPEFALGIVLALAMRSGWRPRFRLEWAVASVVAAHLILAALGISWPESAGRQPPNPIGDLLLVGPYGLLIVTAAARDLATTPGWLTQNHWVRLGQWSFALYLVHELVLRAAEPLDRHLDLWPAITAAALLVAASIALSGWLYRTVEQPWERRLRPRSPAEPPARRVPART